MARLNKMNYKLNSMFMYRRRRKKSTQNISLFPGSIKNHQFHILEMRKFTGRNKTPQNIAITT